MQTIHQPIADVCPPLVLPSHRVWIYLLRDPDTDAVRYVGKTFYPPGNRARLRGHISNPTNEAMAKWIQSLKGRKPMIQEIEEVTPSYNWPSREKFWIRYYLDRGCNLLNVQSGGLSGDYLRFPTKWRQPRKKLKLRKSNDKPPKPVRVENKMCQKCGAEFVTSNPQQIYCKKSHPAPPPVELEKVCEICGKKFKTIYPFKKYCMPYHPKPLLSRNCISCGRSFETRNAGQLRCVPSCNLDKLKPKPFKVDPKIYGCRN